MPPDVALMLAGLGVPASLLGWAAEPKLDGWRAQVSVDGGAVVVRSRHGKRLDGAVGCVEVLAGRRLVVDGEVVARQGRPSDFHDVAPRLA